MRSGYAQPRRFGAKNKHEAKEDYVYEYESMRARIYRNGSRGGAGNRAHVLRQDDVLLHAVRQKFLLFAMQKSALGRKMFALHTKAARELSGAKHS